MRRNTIVHKLILTVMLLILWPGLGMAQSDDVVSQEYRIKIDEVDASKAPKISIRATFLDKKSHPVNPNKITQMDVLADGDLVESHPDITTFKASDLPLDLALIVPISQRFSKDEIAEMQASMSKVIGQARKNDRVAGFFDDGRAINVVPLGKADDVTKVLGEMKPMGQPSFLYSSLDKAIEEMLDPAKMRKARRAIILVTDAYDTYTFKAAEVQKEVYETYKLAKANNIRIYVVMYKPFIPSLIPLFEGLSRKSGGTYRYAEFPAQISKGIDDAWGEIFGELFIEFKQSGLRKDQEVVYKLEATREGGIIVPSEPSAEIKIGELAFNWVKFWIITGIIIGIVVVSLVVFMIARKIRQKREMEEAAREEQELQEKIERGEVCPICRRTMLPEWKECMFCAREKAEEVNRAKQEQAKKAQEKAQNNAQKAEGRVCQKCGRTMLPQWKECMFCKSGIGSDNASVQKGMAPTGAERKDKNQGPVGARICPVCHREMKPHWTICLYCEADAGGQAAGQAGGPNGQNPPQQAQPRAGMPGMPGMPGRQNQNQNAGNGAAGARICPTCGMPMKPHWDVCLYCEANHR